MDKSNHQLEFEIKTILGETKKYSIVPLKQKEAARIFHQVLSQVVSAFAEIGGMDSENKIAAIGKAIKGFDFDTYWGLIESMFSFAMVDDKEIKNLGEYFAVDPTEGYLALFHAILANYPAVFSGLREKLEGFDLAEITKF